MAEVPGHPRMLMMRDGEMFAAPPDFHLRSDPKTARVRPDSDTCSNPNQWNGDVPPSCDNNGAFARQYTGPSNDYLEAGELVLPASNPYMPINSPNGDMGYIYIEGWPGAGTSDSEGGFIYSATYNNYAPYEAVPGQSVPWYGTDRLSAGSAVDMVFFAECPGETSDTACATILAYNESGGYIAENTFPDPGWVNACCIFATMTTIGQKPKNVFNDGSEFGPIGWGDVYICVNAYGCVYPPFPTGTQLWPDNTTKVIIVPSLTAGTTLQTIDLHS